MFAAGGIGQAAKRQADNRVKPDENAPKQADLRIGEMKLLTDGLGERADYVAVIEIEDIDEEKDQSREKVRVARFIFRHNRMLAHRVRSTQAPAKQNRSPSMEIALVSVTDQRP